MLKVDDLGEMSVCHTARFDWNQVPMGYDWVVISALRIVAMNKYPLKEDEVIEGMLRPLRPGCVESEDLRVLCLHSTQLGGIVDYLIEHEMLPREMSYALPTPLVVLARPADKQSDVILIEDDVSVDGVGFS